MNETAFRYTINSTITGTAKRTLKSNITGRGGHSVWKGKKQWQLHS